MDMKNSNCPMCTTGRLVEYKAVDEIVYNNQILSVETEYSVCAQCGEEMILPDQIKRNDCRIRDAWRKADGLLTGAEIISLRTQLNLTQKQAAIVFGGGPNAFSKYERGEVIQSEAMDKLLRLALEKQAVAVFDWLCTHSGMQTGHYQDYGKIIEFPLKNKVSESAQQMVGFNQAVRYG